MVTVNEEFPGENKLDIHPDFLEKGSGYLQINGRNNVVKIEQPHHIGSVYMLLTGENTLELGAFLTLAGDLHFNLLAPAKLSIGTWSSFSPRIIINLHESADITIGKECLFASDITVSCSPIHKILDKDTRVRINPARPVVVGDHVWVSARASLFGGTNVGHDSVVGHSSYVSKEYPPHSLLAGAPARVVRENITWEA
jgi:acetyltransferase-like isoleucine patch superfamily enzyme